jgi:hypothetical protein
VEAVTTQLAGVRPDPLVRRAAGQVSCPLRDETAILNLRNDTYYGLNVSGTRVWDLLAEPRRVSEITDLLVAEFDVSPEICEQDIHRLMAELQEVGLIEVLNEPAGAASQLVRG